MEQMGKHSVVMVSEDWVVQRLFRGDVILTMAWEEGEVGAG